MLHKIMPSAARQTASPLLRKDTAQTASFNPTSQNADTVHVTRVDHKRDMTHITGLVDSSSSRTLNSPSTSILTACKDFCTELLWPTRCAGCERGSELICPQCKDLLLSIDLDSACPLCGAPFGSLCCTECRGRGIGVDRTASSYLFAYPLDRMIVMYKDAFERRLAQAFAAELALTYSELKPLLAQRIDCIVFVPASAEAYARRGYDHMEHIARFLSDAIDLPVQDVLIKQSGKDQRHLNRAERLFSSQQSYELIGDIRDASVLLVDDVLTTGSTIRHVYEVLRQSHVKSITALTLARVF